VQQYIAPVKISFPVAGFMHAVLQERQGSLGLDIFESLQVSDACLHVATETCELCPPSTPERKSMVTAVIARTAAIMIIYSKEPCALAMIE
jgi:hypothetical protein